MNEELKNEAGLSAQWALCRSAPVPLISLTLALIVTIWSAVHFLYAVRLANRDSEIAWVTRQRDEYKEKLGGATPDEAKAKLDALQRTVDTVIGSRWEPLSTQEIDQLAARLKTVQPKFLNILYENELGRDLAESLLEAFKRAGWREAYASRGMGYGQGIVVAHGAGVARSIKDAMEAVTKLRVRVELPDEPDSDASVYYLSIGIFRR